MTELVRDALFPGSPFQHIGAISNTRAGRTFQEAVQRFLSWLGLESEREFVVAIGHATKKP